MPIKREKGDGESTDVKDENPSERCQNTNTDRFYIFFNVSLSKHIRLLGKWSIPTHMVKLAPAYG